MRLTNLTWPKAQEYFEKNDMVLISMPSMPHQNKKEESDQVLNPRRILLMLQNQCYFNEILFAVSRFLELTKSAQI